MTAVFSSTEVALVNQIFAKHDPKKFGVITGDRAVNIFRHGGANLNATTSSHIWDIADADNEGFLTRKGVSVAVRLIGWAQKGVDISPELVNKRERDKSSPSESFYSSRSKLAPSPSLMG
jgi:epidermal growth factor receptor substrate 15